MLKNITNYLALVASLLLMLTLMPVSASDSTEMLSIDKSKNRQSEVQQVEKTNINQATNKELAAIKGIGTKKAQAIIDYRSANGDFINIEQLTNVKGIGKGTLKKIAPYITLL